MQAISSFSDATFDDVPKPVHVLLLGAAGFIGRHVHTALMKRGLRVTAVCRPSSTNVTTHCREWTALSLETMCSTHDWLPHLQSVDLVINCVGILRQRLGERYDDVHHRMPAALAQACAQVGVRLIHTSALGLHAQAKSRFLLSKLLGEEAIAASGADFCIVRPSLIDGLGGFGASWLRMLARWPVHCVPRGAVGKIAAVQATDLGEAYAQLAQLPTLTQHRQVNLGGERLFSYGEYLQLLRGVESGHRPALQIPLPNWITRIGAHLCDLFRFSPFSYGHWILLQRDNVPVPNALPDLLGRAPLAVTYQRIALKDDFRMS
ncbi:MAG: NAD-dependent epimerase/dehydratase family protein [Brachymonas sp.]